MDNDKKKFWIVAKRLGIFLGTLLVLIFVFKFAVYFMPFLIAGMIALMIEPVIKFFMNRLKMSRRLSSIIIITLTIVLIIALVVWGRNICSRKINRIFKRHRSIYNRNKWNIWKWINQHFRPTYRIHSKRSNWYNHQFNHRLR